MYERYYIIGALALVLGLLAIYVIASIGRYRRAVRRSRMPQLVADTECEAKYLAEDDSISAAFTASAAEPAAPSVEPEPIVALVGQVAGAAPAAAVPIVPPALEPESLEQPDEPRRAAVVPEPIPMAADIPDMDELTRLMLSLESSAPAPARVPESASQTAPTPAPTSVPVPAPTSTPAPAPVPAPASEPSLPGYTLADELERLMGAATAESALLPSEVHVRDAVSPAAAAPPKESAFEAPPMAPPPSLGRALSGTREPLATPIPQPIPAPAPVAAPPAPPAPARPARPVAVVASVPPAGAENSAVAPRPAAVIASAATERPDSVPGYALVAPVELHFTGGQGRVGVKPGTRSYAEFQRLAGIMLGDLRAARER